MPPAAAGTCASPARQRSAVLNGYSSYSPIPQHLDLASGTS